MDFRRHLPVRSGELVLDLGCGNGRHTIEACRSPCRAVAVDLSYEELRKARYMLVDRQRKGSAPGMADFVLADAQHLPFRGEAFDKLICTEVLEHIPDDRAGIRELHRVLRPGGEMAVSVPHYWPELVFWNLSWEYWHTPGGHLRLYKPGEMAAALRAGGLEPHAVRYRHAFQSVYWFLRCLFGKENEDFLVTKGFLRFLNWQQRRRLRLLERIEAVADLIIGKDMILYGRKPSAVISRGEGSQGRERELREVRVGE